MKTCGIPTKAWFLVLAAGVGLLVLGGSWQAAQQAVAAETAAAPAAKVPHRVVAIYFHRTQRCPTCKRISAYIEESVKSGFTKQIKDGQVSVHLIDFQNPKNQKYTRHYNISGPTLVLADVHDGKLSAWKPMPKVWSLVAKKAAFFKYVQDGVRGYLEEKKR